MENKLKKSPDQLIEELDFDAKMPVKKTIAIFGGSFDPPTHIHFKVFTSVPPVFTHLDSRKCDKKKICWRMLDSALRHPLRQALA